MNLIVFVDKNQKVISCEVLKNLPNCQKELLDIVNNKVVVFDAKSKQLENLFLGCKKIFFDKRNEISTFFDKQSYSSQKISSYKQLFSLSSTICDDNIFLFGDEFSFVTRGYAQKIILIRINKTYIQGEKYIDLLEDKNYEILLNGNPYFESGQEYSISIFKNKCPDKY